jgi:hypothetical protein
MKTKSLKVGIVIVMTGALGLGLGDNPKSGDQTTPAGAPPGPALPADAGAAPSAATNAPAPPVEKPEGPGKPAGEIPTTPAPAATNVPAPRLVQSAALPPNLKLSPALTEVVKMVHAGVGEEVLLSYITSSTNAFYMGADEIVYLNDLGVSSPVITALIQQDASPDAVARKQAAVAMNPLPPEIKLTSPASNIYPTTAAPPATGDAVPGNYVYSQPVAAPPEPTPVDTAPPANSQVTSVSYFYDSLAPYGNWVSTPEYGLCWQPTVAVVDTGWRPYATNGRWIWTDAGWYWYSHYSWGWAPFHYGRWCSYPGYGWLWAPDTCWGPSWVTWRYTPYYCGWAPLPPACGYVSGFGLYYGGASVGVGFGFGFGWGHYTYIPTAYMCSPNPYRYYLPPGQAKQIHQNSTVVNNYIVGDNNTIINNGIGLDRVSKVHRGEIPKATIRDASYTRARDVRMERLERHDTGLAVVRPKWPSQPPTSPATLAARTQAELAKDRPLREPARAGRPTSAAGSVVPASATGGAPAARPDSGTAGSTLPARPDGRAGLAATGRPTSAGAMSRPTRPQAAPASSRSAQEPVPVVQGASQTTPAAPQNPRGTTVTPAAVPSRPTRDAQEPASRPTVRGTTVPSRPNQAVQGHSSPTITPPSQPAPSRATTTPPLTAAPAASDRAAQEPASRPARASTAAPSRPATVSPPSPQAVPGRSAPTTAPTPQLVQGNSVAVVSPSRPARPDGGTVTVPQSRASFVPGSTASVRSSDFARPVAPVPAPQAVPGNSFYNSRPVAQPPAMSRPSAPSFSAPSAPSAPAPAFRSAPSAPSAPSRSFSAPSAPAPSRSAPTPSSGGGGGARPSRPGRN